MQAIPIETIVNICNIGNFCLNRPGHATASHPPPPTEPWAVTRVRFGNVCLVKRTTVSDEVFTFQHDVLVVLVRKRSKGEEDYTQEESKDCFWKLKLKELTAQVIIILEFRNRKWNTATGSENLGYGTYNRYIRTAIQTILKKLNKKWISHNYQEIECLFHWLNR